MADHRLHPHPVLPTFLQQLLTMLLLLVVRTQLGGDLSPWLNWIRSERLLVFIFIAGGRDVSKVTVHQALGSFWTFRFLRDACDVAVVTA